MSRIVDSDYQVNALKKLGIYDNEFNKGDLVFKHKVVNVKEKDNIKPSETSHAKSLQRSKYLIIENDIE
jgi:hypothetical protein